VAEELQIRVLNLQFGALWATRADEESAARLAMDESAFREFYGETSKPLLRYLLAVTRNADLAQDLLQEAYCRLLTARPRAMDERQTRNYLFRIATNLMRDRWRRGKEAPLADNSDELHFQSPHWEQKLHIRQAFDRLKPRERQLLWLAYVEGSNHQEIAEHTGLRAGSIRILLFRARRKMLELMGVTLPSAPKVDK
jgi:RNA polymerase sigma-70 factor, ECF subfamily